MGTDRSEQVGGRTGDADRQSADDTKNERGEADSIQGQYRTHVPKGLV